MTNLLSHANPFSDLSNVTLRRVFKADQVWTIEADGQDSAICPGCQSVSRSRHSRDKIADFSQSILIFSSGSKAVLVSWIASKSVSLVSWAANEETKKGKN
jgi:hypothetical protein